MTLLYLIGRKIKKMMSPNNVKAVFLESSWPWLFLYHQMTQVFHPIMEFVLDWSFVFLGWHWCNGVSRKSILCHPILQNDRYQVLFVNVTRTSADFSAICDLIWLPFGVWQAVTKPWSDTKGHPNRCSSSGEILFQTWDPEEVVILWWFFSTFLCNLHSLSANHSLWLMLPGLPRGTDLYPMVSATSAKTKMKLICAQRFPAGLAFDCARVLCKPKNTQMYTEPYLEYTVPYLLYAKNNKYQVKRKGQHL